MIIGNTNVTLWQTRLSERWGQGDAARRAEDSRQMAVSSGQHDDTVTGRNGDAARRAEDSRQLSGSSGQKEIRGLKSEVRGQRAEGQLAVSSWQQAGDRGRRSEGRGRKTAGSGQLAAGSRTTRRQSESEMRGNQTAELSVGGWRSGLRQDLSTSSGRVAQALRLEAKD